jgi:hypothetical protein
VSGTVFVIDCHRQARFHEPWVPRCAHAVTVLHEVSPDWEPPPDACLVASAETYDEPSVSALRRAAECGVPVLVLADGILEYRNAWRNPTQVQGNLFQPVLGHKLACIGASQCRHVESWGNPGVCELVGLPSLDGHRLVSARPRCQEEFHVLVASARTPSYDQSQRADVLRQFAALRDGLTRFARTSEVPLKVTWRLTAGLAHDLGLPDESLDAAPRPLIDVLQGVDAVVSSPSTVVLESMLLGLPVAQVDFSGAPHYVQSAWTIAGSDHVLPVLAELASPPVERMLFQRVALHDALQCATPAAPRLARLVDEMCRIGDRCRAAGEPLAFPVRILPGPPPLPTPVSSPALHLDPTALEVRHLRRALSDALGVLARRRESLAAYEGHVQGMMTGLRDYEGHVQGLFRDLESGISESARGPLGPLLEALHDTRPLFVWGTGRHAEIALTRWPRLGAAVVGFVDGDPRRVGSQFMGRQVLDLPSVPQSGFVLIASSAAAEIAVSLKAAGRDLGRDFAVLPCPVPAADH